MKRGRIFSLASILALALAAGACSHNARVSNDGAIVSAIQSKLYQNPDLKSLSVNVASNQGVVTLSGAVNAPLEKLAVEDLARNTEGVKQVVDQLTVSQPASPPAQTATEAPPEAPAPPNTHRRSEKQARKRIARNEKPSAAIAEQDAEAAREAANSAPQASQAAPQPPPPPQPVTVLIPSGTPVIVRMIDSISSATAQPDQEYSASIFSPVAVGDKIVIPRGANARVQVAEVKSSGHFKGQSELKLALISVTVNGRSVPVQTGYYTKQGSSRGVNSAEKIGGGGGLGALIGGLIGHGKGAGIGAAIGAAGGAIDQEATHGQQVTIPSETELNFTLTSPVTVTLPPDQSGPPGPLGQASQ
ncbi:MAG: BON domain-containing protein [Terriglobia bacterium]